jgi:hypothetical protein
MKYTNTFKISLDFQPWFDPSAGHYKFTNVHMYEELGGQLAFGTMSMIHDGSNTALKLLTDQHTGEITLKDEKEGGLEYKIPVFIINKEYVKNYLKIDFICIKDKAFAFNLHTSEWTNIRSTIESLYPGKKDIRVDTDIQNKKLRYFQNNETDQDFISRLCYSYKRESIFSFGWEGLMIKEIMGKLDHDGNNEKPKPKIWLRENANMSQLDEDADQYSREIYRLPYNCWEDKTGKKETQDYTEWEPINLRLVKRYDGMRMVQTDYYPLLENRKYNMLYQNSNYYTTFRIKDFEMPRYKIGDVVNYKRQDRVASKINWPYKYYLVKSNELFYSTEESDLTDEDGFNFSWISKFWGLEEDGSVALGKEDDPTDTK